MQNIGRAPPRAPKPSTPFRNHFLSCNVNDFSHDVQQVVLIDVDSNQKQRAFECEMGNLGYNNIKGGKFENQENVKNDNNGLQYASKIKMSQGQQISPNFKPQMIPVSSQRLNARYMARKTPQPNNIFHISNDQNTQKPNSNPNLNPNPNPNPNTNTNTKPAKPKIKKKANQKINKQLTSPKQIRQQISFYIPEKFRCWLPIMNDQQVVKVYRDIVKQRIFFQLKEQKYLQLAKLREIQERQRVYQKEIAQENKLQEELKYSQKQQHQMNKSKTSKKVNKIKLKQSKLDSRPQIIDLISSEDQQINYSSNSISNQSEKQVENQSSKKVYIQHAAYTQSYNYSSSPSSRNKTDSKQQPYQFQQQSKLKILKKERQMRKKQEKNKYKQHKEFVPEISKPAFWATAPKSICHMNFEIKRPGEFQQSFSKGKNIEDTIDCSYDGQAAKITNTKIEPVNSTQPRVYSTNQIKVIIQPLLKPIKKPHDLK